MKIKWIHTADVHLDCAQYGLADRSQDVARARGVHGIITQRWSHFNASRVVEGSAHVHNRRAH